MKHIDKKMTNTITEKLWESEEAFRKRMGTYADLVRFRAENPGLWRIDANGKYIYDATGWQRRDR
jgi:hypothetical protein